MTDIEPRDCRARLVREGQRLVGEGARGEYRGWSPRSEA